LVLTTTGDGLLAAVLLGVAAADAWAGGVAVLAVLGGLARFGTTSLAGVAGAQAVLGPAVFVGSSLGAVGSALAALACVAVAPRDWRGLPFGLLAGVVALGPAATGWGDGLVRALGALVGMGLVVCARRLPRPTVTPMAALAAAGVGLLLAVIG
jgi:hypothetical protein